MWSCTVAVIANLFDPYVALWCVIWTLFYTACGWLLRPRCFGDVDGLPRHGYVVAIVHQLITHPAIAALLLLRLHVSGVGLREWLGAVWVPGGGLLERHTQYSSIACMLKDAVFGGDWIGKASLATVVGFAVHHTVTVVGCSMWLLAPHGLGIGTSIALDAEITSGLYCVFKLWPSPWTAALYAVTQPASLILGIWGCSVFVAEPINSEFSSLCVLLCALLVTVRLAGFAIEIPAMKKQLCGQKSIACWKFVCCRQYNRRKVAD
eukprot:TRINITY_DN39131_c0_g1_i1.p1 TRINITY_DN39131_c0_g1~~TRINITY_DN39131_c0_g1_i1.p1  ORF type:complete len:264 (+),score=15.16 TRINITY_DN39131_c0_g1_i1:67-858(+)